MPERLQLETVVIDGVVYEQFKNPSTRGSSACRQWIIWPYFDKIEDMDPSAVRLRDDTPPELRKKYEEWKKARSDALKEGMILD